MKEQQINTRHLADKIEECFIQLENNVKMLSDALSEKRFPKEETAEETALALKDMKRLRESVAALARQASQPAPDSLSDIRSLIDSFETQLERERLLEFILHLHAVPPTSDELLANLKREAHKVLSDRTASRDAVAEFALVRQFVLSTRDLHDMERYGSIATRFGFPLFVAVIQGLIAADKDGEEERTPQTPVVENDDVHETGIPVETVEEPENVLRIISNPAAKLAVKEITKENKWAKGMSRHFLPVKLLGFMGIASSRQMELGVTSEALSQSIEYLKKEGYLGEATFGEEPLYFLASKGQALLTNSNCLAALEKYRILQKSERRKLFLPNPDELPAISRTLYRLSDFWDGMFSEPPENSCLWIERDSKTGTPFLVAQKTFSDAPPLIFIVAEANDESEAAISQQYSQALHIWVSIDEGAAAWATRHKSDFTVFWRAPGIVQEILPDRDAVCEDETATQFIKSLLAKTAEKSHVPVPEQTDSLPADDANGRSEASDMPVSDDEKRVVDGASSAPEQERSFPGDKAPKSGENFHKDTLPEPSATETPPARQVVRDAEFISKITRTMTEQLRRKRFAEVCLLLRSSAPYDETGELAALSELLEFALGDPAASRNDMVTMSKLTDDLQKLQESDDDWSTMVSCLRVTGNLRLLCVGRKDRSYARYHLDKEMQSCLDDENMSVLPHLKETFNLLRTLVKNTDLNLETACAMDDSSANQNLLDFPKKAADFLQLTSQLSTKQYKHEKVNDVLHRFYRDDQIIKFMKEAKDDNISQSGACMKFCSDFLAKNQTLPTSVGDVTVWSDQAVDNYIDRLWDASRVKTRQKNDKFKGDLRNTTTKNLKEMLSILACWSADVETRTRSGTDIILWRQKKPQLKQAFQELEAECDALRDEESLLEPFVNTLGYIAHEYGDILSNGISARDKRYFYLSFLRTCHVELEEREGAYLPVKEEDITDLPEFRLCERVLRHCQESLPPWKEVVQSIFQPDGDDITKCDDFGQARLIRDYLTEKGQKTEEIWPQTFSLEASAALVAKNINQEYERFIGDVETALNRGQLQFPNENEWIVSMVSLRKAHYRKTGNFGFLRRLMQAYRRRISKEGEERGRNLRERLESKREALTLDGKELPIVGTIEELLKKGECTLAEDYLSKAGVGMGELSIEYNSNSSRQVNDYLNRFMDEYNRIYESCRLLNRKTADVYYNLYGSGPLTRDSKATARFLNAWFPKTNEQILQFLESLDFHVQEGTLKELSNPRGSYRLYEVQITEHGASDYSHPIAAFGSSCRTLRLILLAGVLKYKEILNRIQHDDGNTALVLTEGSLPLTERRNFAKEMKQLRKTTYCLIDRPLMIFLSQYMPYERKQVMLACALPFSFYQPYTEGSSVRIPPEMFRGRQSERISIQSFDGANLVYGGRQLGKTALLDRVASDFNQVNSQTAIKITIREKRYDKVAEMITDELVRAKLIPPVSQSAPMGWEKLYNLLRDNIGSGHPCKKLLLMLDEGDAFLKSCFEVQYEPIDYLKRLQLEALPGKFKFVIAGLRNLVEFDHKYRTPNSPLGHLHHLQIGPLSYQDARELFELPLSYLGIQVPTDEESQRMLNRILATTNYYPGLIQFYCSNLIETLASEYERCGYRLKDSPPYQLSETHVHTVLQDTRFQKAIEDKFKMTLDLGKDNPEMKDSENYYLILASVLAYAYYQQEYHNKCTLAQFRHICSQFGISRITSLTDENISAFLKEMCILNIFSSDGGKPPSYSFSRHNFFLMMGSEEELWQKLCEEFGGMA